VLSLKIRRKYATTEGSRYFWEARYVSVTFDAAPETLVELRRQANNEEGILKVFTVKHKNILKRSMGKNYKNPYLRPNEGQLETSSAMR
jgi:hypothetical protein